ncbi:MAG: trigger factor [Gammaproteobacteria bacterium 39-13]|nr:trigger factor [Gammaproteobacteria bacterium]OJV94946.1 MAG: trigger factor [Gammaproteobacteria bacterium 39-13]
MEVSVENTSTLGRRLKVSVPEAKVASQIKARMAKLGREAHLKGFRPGKVPLSVLEQKFGDSVKAEVINELIKESLSEAVEKNELQPAGVPKIEELKNEAGKDLEFVASFEIYPEIALTDLSGVELDKRNAEITDADVDSMIGKLQDQLANWNVVDRAAQKEDRLTVDFARLLKNEDAEREEQKNVQMVIGVEGVLPGLSEALIGKTKGDEIQVDLTYPADWADSPVAGKDVTLWVTIHEVAEKQLLSEEELASKLAIEDFTHDKIAAKVRERMQEELDQVLQDEIKEKVLEVLLDKNPIEVPYALIEQEKEAIHREMMRARRGKVSKEALNSSEVETSAKRRVELGLLLNEVIKKHNLKSDGKLVRAQIDKIASKFPKPSEIVDAYYGSKELLYSVERLVLLEQAVDAILKEAKVIDKKVSFDEVMNPAD